MPATASDLSLPQGAKFQINPNAKAGYPNGSVDSKKRLITQKNIDDLLNKIKFDKNGKAKLGHVTHHTYSKNGVQQVQEKDD